jgi:hypothetical protein
MRLDLIQTKHRNAVSKTSSTTFRGAVVLSPGGVMEVCRYVAFSALILGVAFPLHGQALQTSDAPQVLAAAREALGGEKRLTAIKTFVATGRTRQVRGGNLVPVEFEITCELPDKYIRKDEIPAQDTDIAVSGFSGDALVQFPPLPSGRVGAGSPLAAQRLTTLKQDFARLMLGIFATSFPTYPLTFTYGALGEAPEGQADILDVAGSGNFAARLVVQRTSHLPVMLMWQAPATPAGGRGAAPPPAAAAPLVEHRLYYGDFRDVSGVKWPFRIRRAIAGDTVEETTFDRIRLNVKIDPRKFEAPK